MLQSKTVRERAYVPPIRDRSVGSAGNSHFKMGLVLVLVVVLVAAVSGQEPPGHLVEPRRIDSVDNGLATTELILAFVVRLMTCYSTAVTAGKRVCFLCELQVIHLMTNSGQSCYQKSASNW